MPKAVVDPAELRQFASNLKTFNERMRDQTVRLNGQFQHLGETWRDQEHKKFAEVFQQTMHTLTQFMKVSQDHIPFLTRKAEAAEEYLRRR